jgi:hypothetical protein
VGLPAGILGLVDAALVDRVWLWVTVGAGMGNQKQQQVAIISHLGKAIRRARWV